MIRSLFILLTLLLSQSSAIGQTFSWAWSEAANSAGIEQSLDITVDPVTGDNFICGYYEGDMSGEFTVGTNGTVDFSAPVGQEGFVAKYDAAGVFQWAFNIDGVGNQVATGVDLDATGNVYVTGYFQNTTNFDGVTTSAASSKTSNGGTEDVFLAKYNAAGEVQWVVHGDSPANAQSLDVDINDDGVFITGWYLNALLTVTDGTSGVDNTTLIAGGDAQDVFVGAFNFDGSQRWLKRASGSSTENEFGYAITANQTHVYVVGSFRQTTTFYDPIVANQNETAFTAGTESIFIAAYDENVGGLSWVDRIGTSGGDVCTGRGVHANGAKLYLTGGISDDSGFPVNFPGAVIVTIAASSNEEIFLAQIDTATQATDWVNTEINDSPTAARGEDIITNQLGNIVVSGSFYGNTTFDTGSVLSDGGADIFVAVYDNTGAGLLTVTAGSTGDDWAYGVGYDNTTSYYTTGSYASDLSALNLPVVSNAGAADIHVSKISNCEVGINYSPTLYCQTAADANPSINSPGGTFSAPPALIWANIFIGQIDVSATPPGVYPITYTQGTCQVDSTINITIVAEDDPFFEYLPSTTFCGGDPNPIAANVAVPGGTFTGSAPVVFVDNLTGEIDLGATPDGNWFVIYNSPGPDCPNASLVPITVAQPQDPSFVYLPSTLCVAGADAVPAFTSTPGGTFSESSGNVVITSFGLIDVSASTIGTWFITYTTPGPVCAKTDSSQITISAEDDPSFTYPAPIYCQGDANPIPTITGTGGGTFTAPPAVVFVDINTGEVDLLGSTAGGPYTITYTTPGPCTHFDTYDITINPEDDATFDYPQIVYCQGDLDPIATNIGTGGGLFTAPPQIVFLNTATGEIDVSASTPGGPYTITYDTPGPNCPNTGTFDVSISAEDDATFTYPAAIYCQGVANPVATVTGTAGGIFSAIAGVVFVSSATGEIDLLGSTAGGPYWVVYTTPGPDCIHLDSTQITINAEDDPSFTYSQISYCSGEVDPAALLTGTGGGLFTAPAQIVFLNTATGLIDLDASTLGGPYTITYTTPGPDCPNVATFDISISATDDPFFDYAQAAYCQGEIDPLATNIVTPGGTFSAPAGIVFLNTATGLIDLSACTAGGPYAIKYVTTDPCKDSTTFDITINPAENPAFNYSAPTYCQADIDPVATVTGTGGGVFTGPAQITFVSTATGEIDLSASTVGGPYFIVYTTPGPQCPTADSVQVTINPEDDPSFNYSASIYCTGGTNPLGNITGTAGGIFSGEAGILFVDVNTGEINLSTSTIGGPYWVYYTTPGPDCPNVDSVQITISPIDDASFTYPASNYCQADVDPIATITGLNGGTFTGPAQVIFVNASTGEIDLSASTIGGPYWIVYTTPGPNCPTSDSVEVTIDVEDDPSFNYSASNYCEDGVNPLGTITGTGGGTFSGQAGIVFVDVNTGEIDLGTSTVGGPYWVYYTTPGPTCPNVDSVQITIDPIDDASFNYSASDYCQADIDPLATITGAGGGVFSGPPQVTFISTATGEIDLSASTVGGPYWVYYTTPGPACPNIDSAQVTINPEDDPSFNYAGLLYCQGDPNPVGNITGTGGGTFSGQAGIVFADVNTGEVDLLASTAGGPYWVYYTTPGPNCANVDSTQIIILAEDDASFTYAAQYCQNDPDPIANITGTPGGLFTGPAQISFVNSSTGELDVSASVAGGPYWIVYTTPGPSCPHVDSVQVTILPEEDASFTYSSATYCQADPNPTGIITGTGGGTFSGQAGVIFVDVNTGEIDLAGSTPGGPYWIYYDTPGPTCPNVDSFQVSIGAEDDPTFDYAATNYCQGVANPIANLTGTGGGIFTAPPQVVFVSSATGEIDLLASTPGGPYTITYTTPGPLCPNSMTFDVTIDVEDDPFFDYPQIAYCQIEIDPVATNVGTPGGSFSGPVGVVFVNTTTGEIDVSASTIGGPYTISYTTPGPTCPNTSTFDISITLGDDPFFDYAQIAFCQGDVDPLATNVATLGGTFTAPAQIVFLNTGTGEIDVSASTVGGPYTIKYVTTDPCKDSTTFDITINAEDDPTFNYSAANYCQGAVNPLGTITGTGGGTFSGQAGVVFVDLNTGEIDLAGSTAGGPYWVYYTTPGPDCPNIDSVQVTIDAEDDPFFDFPQIIYCQGDLDPVATNVATAGGIFSAPAQIIFLNTATGEIDLSASTVGGPYTITYTTPGPNCPNATTFDISISAEDDASFNYTLSAYCQGGINPLGNITGTAGGTFTSQAGLLFVDVNTGEIDLAGSTAGGTYWVYYTTPGPDCPNIDSVQITIDTEDDPFFDYPQIIYCQADADPIATNVATAGGLFSGPAQIVFLNTATGEIDVSASTVGGPYTITYNTPGPNCPNSTTFDVSISAEDDASFNYTLAAYCQGGINPLGNITGTAGGTFSSQTGLVFVDVNTGEIDLAGSTAGGTYWVYYTTPGPDCPNIDSVQVSIDIEDDPFFDYPQVIYCQADADPIATNVATAGGLFSGPAQIVFLNTTTGEIDVSASTVGGPYTITYTSPGPNCPNATTFDITISAEEDPSFTYPAAVYCQGDVNPLGTITGTPGGTYSGQAGVVFVDVNTGEIDLAGSTAGGPYWVYYTTPGANCSNIDSVQITINAQDDPTFTFASQYCQHDSNPSPIITGTPGGIFSGPTEIVFINTSTGEIFLAASTVGGPYWIVYTTPGPNCPSVDSVQVTILAADDPGFTYPAPIYCQGDPNPSGTITGTPGGTFSGQAGVVFANTSTGEIDLLGSTAGGPYWVYYTTPLASTCTATDSLQITINPEEDPTFTYNPQLCLSDPNPTAAISGTPGGVFSGPTEIVFANTTTGEIDLGASTLGGPYWIVYNTPGPNCPHSDSVQVSISVGEDPSFNYAVTQFCPTDTDPIATVTGTAGGTFTGPVGIVILDPATGEIDLDASTPGTYAVIYTTPGPICQALDSVSITINAFDDPTFSYSALVYCQSDANPTPTITGVPGGTFTTVFPQLAVDTVTGEIDLLASTPGTNLVVLYTTPGMCFDTSMVLVSILEAPTADAGPDQVLGALFTTTLDAVPPTIGTGLWTLTSGAGDILDPTDPISLIENLGVGSNELTWTVSNGSCPDAVDVMYIQVDDIWIPDVVTPNGDGFNDQFVINGIQTMTNNVQIYNRWGQLVFEVDNYQNDWDGFSSSGVMLESETYFYIISLADGRQLNGYLVLKR